MKGKVLIICVVLASLLGYLEWSGGNRMFLYQAEAEIMYKLFTQPQLVMHPFILLPLLGQVLLLATLLRERPNKILVFAGMAAIGILYLFMLFIGIISSKFRITLSTVPFLTISIWLIVWLQKEKLNY